MKRLEYVTVSYVSPTDTQGAKFKAEYKTGNKTFSIKVAFDYSINCYENAYKALEALFIQHDNINLMHVDCLGFTLENDKYTFIFK